MTTILQGQDNATEQVLYMALELSNKKCMLNYNYDSSGNTLTDGAHNYSYNNAGRLTQASTGAASNTYLLNGLGQRVMTNTSAESYSYDADGNRTSRTVGTSTTSYSYPGTSNKLASLTGTSTLNYNYDASGNTLTDGAHNYSYNNAGRLTQASTGAASNTYLLNGLGQRVVKLGSYVPTGQARYVYDEAGHLIGDYDLAATAQSETVYLGDMPVAVVQGNTLYYTQADHLNTPRALANSSNTTVWRWDSDAFGTTPANEDPDGNGVKVSYNQRFPGQYFDKETGLHYNYFRDYDPGTGRYVESDPIGLEGGINTYQYVGNNPLSYTDPLGLMTVQCTKPLNTMGGSGAKSGPDIWGNPLYHQYSCVIRGGKVVCGGQDRGGDGAGKPSNDSASAGQCKETQPDNDCLEKCLINEWAKPRPKYGVIPFGTDCQDYDDDVNTLCRKKCGLK